MNRSAKNIIGILLLVILIILSCITVKAASDSLSGGNRESENMPQMSNEAPPAKPGENSSSSSKEIGGENKQETPPEKPNEDNLANNDSVNKQYYILFGIEGLAFSIILIYMLISGFNAKDFGETLNSGVKILLYIILVCALTAGLVYCQKYVATNVLAKDAKDSQIAGLGEQNSSNVTYTAVKEITEDADIDGDEYTSTKSDENGVLVNGDVQASLSNIKVTKSGDSKSGDSSNFYGNNSAILAKSGANTTIKNAEITTNASGANGVFSYGGSATTNNSSNDGTQVNISDSKITTTGDNAGGIMTTGGGTTNATNLEIETSGTSSAAIRSDRGGGKVIVNKGTYTTNGQGSPAIYSTADITANDAKLVSNASEGAVIEGANSISLDNCELVDNNSKLNGQSTTYKNIFLYQSMSGDASSNGHSTFTAKNSKITTNKGDSFYVTNTTAVINLENNEITNNDGEGNFLRAQKDSWGNSGSNGGNVTLNMKNQEATGNIAIDSISTLTMNMEDNSYYEGTINGDKTAKNISLKLDSSSKIKLTGDSYITSLDDSDSSYGNIDFNGYKLYVNGNAIN